MVITVDLYKELEIDRSWGEEEIRKDLNEKQKIWIRRQGSCNDTEQSLLIDEILNKIMDARKYLCKEIKRKQYDKVLEQAYKDGKIKDDIQEKLVTLLEQARAYYRKGNIKLATKCAKEAVEGQVNDPEAYDLLARCYYEANDYIRAIGAVDAGIQIFKDNLNLHWLGARIATIGSKDYDDAQRRINTLIEKAPDKAIGHSEQIYLHLRKGDEDLAFQEIDTYISAHPEDESFKKGVAYDLDAYSNSCYYYDEANNATFIADKESYEKCLKLRTKASEIYHDEHTNNQLENARYFGQKEWNSWNMESIKSLTGLGILFFLLSRPIGLVFLSVDALLIYFSFRPYWQINKTYVTGKMGGLEQIVNVLGNIAAKLAWGLFRFCITFVEWFIKFIFALASGRFF